MSDAHLTYMGYFGRLEAPPANHAHALPEGAQVEAYTADNRDRYGRMRAANRARRAAYDEAHRAATSGPRKVDE